MLSGYTIFLATQEMAKMGAANAARATQGAPFAMRALSPPSLSGAANAL